METESIQLRDQVGVLRRRWRIVVATVLLTVAAGVGLGQLQEPMYTASAKILPAGADDPRNAPTDAQILTEAQKVKADSVARQVLDRLQLQESETELLDSVTVEADANGAATLTITALRRDRDQAAPIARAFAEAYLGSSEERVARKLDQIQSDIDELNAEISRLTGLINTAPPLEELTQLRSDRRAASEARNLLVTGKATLLVGGGGEAGGAILEEPQGARPASPNLVRTIGLAAVLGLLLGIGLAYLRDYFDDVVRDEAELHEVLGNRPVLGRIPHFRESRSGRLAALIAPHSPASEAYRALGANMRFLLATARPGEADPTPGRVLLVTSSRPEEGKTSTAGNLAVVAARAGLRVILVDADLRRPQVATLLGLGDVAGLSDLLASNASADRYLIDVGVEDLWVLPAGTVPPNPAELLASQRMRTVLSELLRRADLVVLDSPAILAVADPLELVPVVDLTLLVARAGTSRKRNLAGAMQRIRQLGGVVPGIVLNDVPSKDKEYAYGYGYGAYEASSASTADAPERQNGSGASVVSGPQRT